MLTMLIVLIFLVMLYGAVAMKLNLRKTRGNDMTEKAVTSPASKALGELVGIAGGIYLSLILICTFLKLTVPTSIKVASMEMDPLAAVAVIVAVSQPFFLHVLAKFRK